MASNLRTSPRRSQRIAKRGHADNDDDPQIESPTPPKKRKVVKPMATLTPRSKKANKLAPLSPQNNHQLDVDWAAVSETFRRADAACLDWEKRYENDVLIGELPVIRTVEHTGSDAEQHAHANVVDVAQDAFLAQLIANIESSRVLRGASAKALECRQKIELWRHGKDGKGGIDGILKELQDLDESGRRASDPKRQKLQARLQEFEEAITMQEHEEDLANTSLHHGCRFQEVRDGKLYELAENVTIDGGSPLEHLPPGFFHDLHACRKLADDCKHLQTEQAAVDSEELSINTEFDRLAFRKYQLRRGRKLLMVDIDEETAEVEERIQHLLLVSLPAASRRRDELAREVAECIRRRSEAEQSLNRSAEDALVAAGCFADEDDHVALSKSEIGSKEARKTPAIPRVKRPYTPVLLGPDVVRQLVPDPSDVGTELIKRLKVSLRDQVRETASNVRACRERLDAMEGGTCPDSIDDNLSGIEKGLRYFLAKQESTRALIEAESTYNDVLRRAHEAGVEGIEPQTSGFADHRSDSYDHAAMKAHKATTDYAAIQEWVATCPSDVLEPSGDELLPELLQVMDMSAQKALELGLVVITPKGFQFLRGGGSAENDEDCGVALPEPGDIDDWSFHSFHLGESYSIIAEGETRAQITQLEERAAILRPEVERVHLAFVHSLPS